MVGVQAGAELDISFDVVFDGDDCISMKDEKGGRRAESKITDLFQNWGEGQRECLRRAESYSLCMTSERRATD